MPPTPLDTRRKIRSLPPLVAETALLLLRIYPDAKLTAYVNCFTARLLFAPPIDARHHDIARRLSLRVELQTADGEAYISICVPKEVELWYWCKTPAEAVGKVAALAVYAPKKYETIDP